MKDKTYDSDMRIIDLPLSRKTKRIIQEMELCTIKDLDNKNYFTLKDKFTAIYDAGTIIKEMNTLGFLIPPENEKLLHDANLSKRVLNILSRYDIFYLSELIEMPKENLKRFRGLGQKSLLELEIACSSYGVELKTLQPIKENFEKVGIKDSRYYQIFFNNHILELADLQNKSIKNLYTMCGYKLAMKLYYILAGKKLYNLDQTVYYIFQVLSPYQSRQLYRICKIEMLEQLTDFRESDLLMIQGIGKASVKRLAAILDKNGLSLKKESE